MPTRSKELAKAKPATLSSPSGTARRTKDGIEINANTQKGVVSREYKVEEIRGVHKDVATPPAYRLTKKDGTAFDVHTDPFGVVKCTCEDSTYRQRECKHILTLRSMGMLK